MAIVASAVALGSPPSDQDVPFVETITVSDQTELEPNTPSATTHVMPASRLHRVDIGTIPTVRLDSVDLEALRREDLARTERGEVPRIGVGRDISISLDSGKWYDIPSVGRLWSVDVIAQGAVGVRLHFSEMNLRPGAQVWAYSPSDFSRVAGPYEGRGSHDEGEFWTLTLSGERVRLEYFVPLDPPDTDNHSTPFFVDRLQHIYSDPLTGVMGIDSRRTRSILRSSLSDAQRVRHSLSSGQPPSAGSNEDFLAIPRLTIINLQTQNETGSGSLTDTEPMLGRRGHDDAPKDSPPKVGKKDEQ